MASTATTPASSKLCRPPKSSPTHRTNSPSGSRWTPASDVTPSLSPAWLVVATSLPPTGPYLCLPLNGFRSRLLASGVSPGLRGDQECWLPLIARRPVTISTMPVSSRLFRELSNLLPCWSLESEGVLGRGFLVRKHLLLLQVHILDTYTSLHHMADHDCCIRSLPGPCPIMDTRRCPRCIRTRLGLMPTARLNVRKPSLHFVLVLEFQICGAVFSTVIPQAIAQLLVNGWAEVSKL